MGKRKARKAKGVIILTQNQGDVLRFTFSLEGQNNRGAAQVVTTIVGTPGFEALAKLAQNLPALVLQAHGIHMAKMAQDAQAAAEREAEEPDGE